MTSLAGASERFTPSQPYGDSNYLSHGTIPESPTDTHTMSSTPSSHTLTCLYTSASSSQELDAITDQYTTFGPPDMDWNAFVQGQTSTEAQADAGLATYSPLPQDTTSYTATSALPTLSPHRPSSVLALHEHGTSRLERLPEEPRESSLRETGNQSTSSATASLTPASRKPSGPRAGSAFSHLRQKSSRQSTSDLSWVRQVYSTSHGRITHEGRGHGSGGSGTEKSVAPSTSRQRSGTLDLSRPVSNTDAKLLRLASSLPDTTGFGGSHVSSALAISPQSDMASWSEQSPSSNSRGTGGDLPASITAEFESLGLDLAHYAGGVQDVTMGDMYEDGIEMLKSSDQSTFREGSTSTGDASFASTSSSTLESSGLDESLLAPGMTAQPSWTSEGTPLSSPAFSTQLQLFPSSPGTSRYSSLSSSHNRGGFLDKGKGKASEFGALAHPPSSTATWPSARPPVPSALMQSATQSSSLSGVSKRTDHSRLRPSDSRASVISENTQSDDFALSDPRPQMQPCRSADALTDGPPRSSRRSGGRPVSMDSLSPSLSVPRSASLQQSQAADQPSHRPSSARSSKQPSSVLGRVVGGSHRGTTKRVDYDEVSDALETLRKFLQQREAARNSDKNTASMELPSSLPTDEFAPRNRTLRHSIGKLPPRGSVRLDGSTSSTTPRSPTVPHHLHHHRRQHSSFLSTSDEQSREQDRLDAVQHLSERVRALRQRSQRFQRGSMDSDPTRHTTEAETATPPTSAGGSTNYTQEQQPAFPTSRGRRS